MNLIVGRKHTQTKKIPPQYTEERHNLYVNGGCQSVGQTIMANCGKKKNTHYPASRFFSLAWLLAFTKSFASLVSRVVGLFYTPRGQ